MVKKKVIIMGAAGRDFHDFNTFFRNNNEYEVVAFTATQIPNIEGRVYPPELAGPMYPNGIKIYPENELPDLIKKYKVDEVVFSYSDVPHEYVMNRASIALANGASFKMLSPSQVMLPSKVPVIAVCAVRTGSGKSQTTRMIAQLLRAMNKKVVVVRHPMPYGNLVEQAVERFSTFEDLDKFKCTIEEREEYEHHLENKTVVYAGVDYEKILRAAEKEADVILWDGGNNDIPFFKPNLHIVVADPFRAGHELKYHPGETNFRMADIVVINKVNTANKSDVDIIKNNLKEVNPKAKVIEAQSLITMENSEGAKGKNAIIVEDGPTVTHGGMKLGAASLAAKQFGVKSIVDPVPYAVGSIAEVYKKYTHLIGSGILPAMGYSKKQIQELEDTINKINADVVISGTPINLSQIVHVNKPILRVRYAMDDKSGELLKKEISRIL
ncbi:MAG: cyclic 2,3-diphosphoglycerate synthase [Thermoplasmata archaeon]